MILRPCFCAYGTRSGHARHGAVVVHDLADDGGRVQAGEPGEVHAGLGLPGALEHAARARHEREDVPGLHQVAGAALRVDGHLDGVGAVGRRDARGHAFAGLDGDGERRLQARLVLDRHRREVQLRAALRREREAHEAAALLGHEVDALRAGELRGHGEVALVLAVLVVADDDHLALAQVVQRIGDRREGAAGAVVRVLSVVGGHSEPRFRKFLPGEPVLRLTAVDERVHVLGDHVGFEIDPHAGRQSRQRRDGGGVRDE